MIANATTELVPPPKREANAEKLKRYRAEASAKGLCYVCRCRPAKVGRKTCQHCLDESARCAARRERQRRAAGLCACGGSPVPGRTACERCAATDTRNRRRLEDRRITQGLCWRCGNEPIVPGRKQGARCLAETRTRTQAWSRRNGPTGTRVCGACGQPGHRAPAHDHNPVLAAGEEAR